MRAKKVLKMNWLVKSLAPGYYEVLWLCAILCIEVRYLLLMPGRHAKPCLKQ